MQQQPPMDDNLNEEQIPQDVQDEEEDPDSPDVPFADPTPMRRALVCLGLAPILHMSL
jgi:hypothetical protein